MRGPFFAWSVLLGRQGGVPGAPGFALGCGVRWCRRMGHWRGDCFHVKTFVGTVPGAGGVACIWCWWIAALWIDPLRAAVLL